MKRPPVPISIWKNPVHILAFGFGSGLSPYAPGTMGTLVAVPVVYLLTPLSASIYVITVLLMFFIGIWLCDKTSRDMNVHDHSGIVWDEIVGYLITMYAAPTGWIWLLIGFLLFRFFDVVKPWPVSVADRKIHNGFGIMFDDVLAGFYAWAVIQLAALLFLGSQTF